jgi:hypothetical protein
LVETSDLGGCGLFDSAGWATFSGRHKYNLILRNGTPSHNCGYNRRPIVIIGLASSTCVTNSGTARFPRELNNYKNKRHRMTDWIIHNTKCIIFFPFLRFKYQLLPDSLSRNVEGTLWAELSSHIYVKEPAFNQLKNNFYTERQVSLMVHLVSLILKRFNNILFFLLILQVLCFSKLSFTIRPILIFSYFNKIYQN